MNALINSRLILVALGAAVSLSSCYDTSQKADPDSTTKSRGLEYAPQMYHSEPYEALSQIVDKEAGLEYWPFKAVGGGRSDYDSVSAHGEWYNSNYYNPYGMNMKQPVVGSIARGQSASHYQIHPDSANLWATVRSPFEDKSLVLEDGKVLYQRFCQHCHGEEGNGQGLVGVKYGGVPNYHTKSKRLLTAGNIYNTITFGKGTMRPHASLLDPEERWKIAEYIKQWQLDVEKTEE